MGNLNNNKDTCSLHSSTFESCLLTLDVQMEFFGHSNVVESERSVNMSLARFYQMGDI